MNPTEKQIHHLLQRDWDNFPFKLDYLFYLLHINHQDISDIHLSRIGGLYHLYRFRSLGNMHNNLEHNEFTIRQNELCEYLKINNSLNEPIDFSYTTNIFAENYNFRGHKTPTIKGDMIIFRFLDTNPTNLNLNQLLNPNNNQSITEQPAKFRTFNQDFIQLVEKYNLYDDLKQSLDDKNLISEKRLKI